MHDDLSVTRSNLKTPKAAAVAGIIFSILLTTIFGLLRMSIPADPLEPGAWLATDANTVAVAINLMPFAGIAFLWFVGVLRDRLGQKEDRFFSTVFFGSGLCFLSSLFAAAAIIGALLLVPRPQSGAMMESQTFQFARAVAYILANVYAIKMAGMFMISTATVALYTGFAPRWIAYLGYVLALILLIGSYFISWSYLVLPVWVLLLSLQILVDDLREQRREG